MPTTTTAWSAPAFSHTSHSTPVNHLTCQRRNRRGLSSFSLVELLVVIAIIGIVAALSTGAYTQILRSSSLAAGTQSFRGALDFSRQSAITHNADVEFRLYTNASGDFQSYQSFLVASGATNALTKPTFLPKPVVISFKGNSGGKYFSTFDSSAQSAIPMVTAGTTPAGVFRFSSTGGMKLASGTSFASAANTAYFTLIIPTDPVSASTGLPKNFSLIQLDPISGQTSTYRP